MKVAILVLALAVVALGEPIPKMRNLYAQPQTHHQGSVIPRIINGEEAVPHSIPHQVWLTVSGSAGSWLCGGSLITPNFVLTAGHCGFEGDSAVVLLGAHNINKNEATQVKVNSKNIIVHEQFDMDSISNDICIIELAKAVTLNENIKVVQLPSKADVGNSYEGKIARVSGWGLTDGFGNSVSPVLNQVEVPVISNSQCKSVFNIFQEYQICTLGDNGKGSCNGDSGGPLSVANVQVGIVSYGVVYCQAGYPSVFTRTTSFLDWIAKNSDVQIQ